jgi:hypothetical protein
MLGVFIAWLATVASNLKNLSSDDPVPIPILKRNIPERILGYSLIIISTAGLIWQITAYLKVSNELQKIKEVVTISDASLFNEASGGTAVGKFAYIVDDEKPKIFKLEYRDGAYHLRREIPLTQKNGQKIAPECKDEEVDKGCVEDLEAVASKPSDPGPEKLYLITSHSNTKNGKQENSRQRFLEVSLKEGAEGEITNSQVHLRSLIIGELAKLAIKEGDKDLEQMLKDMQDEKISKANRIGGMQIEGLAIDESEYAYIGFRNPIIRKGEARFAIVLRAKLSELFSDKPNFQPFLLTLSHNKKDYGIASIVFDVRSNRILILGSDPEGKWLTPLLCQWDFGEAKTTDLQLPTRCDEVLFKSDRPDVSKPELLLLAPPSVSNKIYMFLDTDGKAQGGLISYERSEFGIVNR